MKIGEVGEIAKRHAERMGLRNVTIETIDWHFNSLAKQEYWSVDVKSDSGTYSVQVYESGNVTSWKRKGIQ